MTKTKTLTLFGLVVSVVAFVIALHIKDFSRLKKVEIGNTPIQLGTLSKIVFTNNQSSKVDFLLRCHFKVRSDGKALFSENVSLAPKSSVEFDVNPGLPVGELPRMIANKSCEAVWRGPFGIERSAWWVSWQYGRPAYKVNFE
jgi:hypothetical protein